MSHNVSSDFGTKIKTWATYEQKSQELKKQLDDLNDKKNKLSLELIPYIQSHNLQKTAINFGNNKVCYAVNSQYNNLSYGFLEESLMVFYNGDRNQVEKIMKFIRSRRTKTQKPVLKCYQKK